MMKGALGALFVALAVAGCAAPRGPAEQPSEYAAGPRPVDVDGYIAKFARTALKDPDSVQIRGVTKPTYMVLDDIPHENATFGWAFCFDMNAKNSYGGYVGYRKTLVVVRRQELVYYLSEDPDWRRRSERLYEVCQATGSPA